MRNYTTLRKGNYIGITELAKIIGTTVTTIKRWYAWYENDEYNKPDSFEMPKYVYLDNMNTKYFHINDIERFKELKASFEHGGVNRGIMNNYTVKIKKGVNYGK